MKNTRMAQLERRKKLSESSPKSPKSQTSPTFDQLLRVEEAYWSSNVSPGGRACHDHEVCPSHCTSGDNKKSVLSKVKDTAKKLRHSISGRRKNGIEFHDHDHDHNYHHSHVHNYQHSHDHNRGLSHGHGHSHSQSHSHDHDHITPSWGATVEDDYDHEQDYDPEYLGAPMYESEAAPDCLKETARQHPRAEPVVSASHRAPNMNYEAALQRNDKPVTPNTGVITNATHAVAEKLAPACAAVSDAAHNTTQTIANKLAPACATVSDATHKVNTNMITNTTHAVADKLAPACAAVSDATHNINTNVITNTTHAVAEKLAPACAAVSDATHNINTNMITNTTHAVADKLAPACTAVSDATHQIASKIAGIAVTSPETQPIQGAKAKLMSEDAGNLKAQLIVSENAGTLKQYATGSPQTYDKGVSVKEYFLNKLEPGEDERALSQAITEAISPRKSTGETGVVDKVKEAVTSFFRQEEASNSMGKSAGSISDAPASSEVETIAKLNRMASTHADKSATASPSFSALDTSNTPTVVQQKRVTSIHEKPASPSPATPDTSVIPRNAQLNRINSVHVRSTKVFTDSTNNSPLIPVSTNAHEGDLLFYFILILQQFRVNIISYAAVTVLHITLRFSIGKQKILQEFLMNLK
ncbi:uncharacterized protein LOC131006763 isoform X1 [Salvia miltiorrhiza]|uniref:uncharacterized protein LOC131006763 isoform X1 n=1 Tax=Salvia miltiorrhiza TaxID=226208 RepID=UPI0025AD8838|nr:uncharacterized protein LOC131006763 isoform X1 [Salvia miltiorrhiza]